MVGPVVVVVLFINDIIFGFVAVGFDLFLVLPCFSCFVVFFSLFCSCFSLLVDSHKQLFFSYFSLTR